MNNNQIQMLVSRHCAHIRKPYTLEEICEQIEGGEYNAELLLQHLLLFVLENNRTERQPESAVIGEANGCSIHSLVGPTGFRHTVKTKSDPYKAPDGKHYWNCWTNNYQPARDGYFQHACCEEDRSGKTLCGVATQGGGGVSIPNELDAPSCLKCRRIMAKRGALRPNTEVSDGR